MEIATTAAPANRDSPEGECSNLEHPGECSRFEHSPEGGGEQARREELAAIHRTQVARDAPYADSVRKMMRDLTARLVYRTRTVMIPSILLTSSSLSCPPHAPPK